MTTGSLPGTDTTAEIPAVVLVSAPWATPSRPAPTVLWELSRRWGSALHTILIEDPSEEMLVQLAVDSLPTWFRFRPATVDEPGDVEESREPTPGVTGAAGEPGMDEESLRTDDPLIVAELSGTSMSGEAVLLPGPWTLVRRRSGALPKHVVEAEFGPGS